MSHKATNWAIQQRGLKPATKLLLWHLCDRHNPDAGCFPSQERLAEDCEMSRSTVQLHLAKLVEAGLVRADSGRVDPETKRQLPTRYFFQFEAGFAPQTKGESGESRDRNSVTEAVTEKGAEPRPKSAESRDRISVSNPVREPLTEPGARARASEPEGSPAPGAEEAAAPALSASDVAAREARFVLEWICEGTVEPLAVRLVFPRAACLSREECARAIERFTLSGLKRAKSWIDWGELIRSGAPANPPIHPVRRYLEKSEPRAIWREAVAARVGALDALVARRLAEKVGDDPLRADNADTDEEAGGAPAAA